MIIPATGLRAGLVAMLLGLMTTSGSAENPIGAVPGTVEPARQWDVAFPIDGHIITINFTEGQLVTAGDGLVDLDAREATVRLAIAKTNLQLAEARHEESRADLERQEKLRAREAVSLSKLSDTKLAERVAALHVERAGLDVQAASARLSQHRLAAPADGVISAPRLHEGSNFNVVDGLSIATIYQLDPINIRARIPVEKVLGRIRDGVFSLEAARDLDIELRFSDGAVYQHTGKVVALGFEIDPETGEGSALMEFPNPSHLLRPGTRVEVEAIVPLE